MSPTTGRPTGMGAEAARTAPAAAGSRRGVLRGLAAVPVAGRAAGAAAGLQALQLAGPRAAQARLEGVNKPELLPPGPVTPVLDVAGFLSEGEVQRIRKMVELLEKDTDVKLRVLAQNYPNTPGLAIKDYWGVDDKTVVFVADPNTGNILNFNVGTEVDLLVPQNFWSRLAGKYGTKKYWQNNGEEVSILSAVSAINRCLREPIGRGQCSQVDGSY